MINKEMSQSVKNISTGYLINLQNVKNKIISLLPSEIIYNWNDECRIEIIFGLFTEESCAFFGDFMDKNIVNTTIKTCDTWYANNKDHNREFRIRNVYVKDNNIALDLFTVDNNMRYKISVSTDLNREDIFNLDDWLIKIPVSDITIVIGQPYLNKE